MCRCIILPALLLVGVIAQAGDIQWAKVQHKNGIYILELEVVLASRFEPVHAIVTDYDQLHRISEVLVETALISEPDAEIKRRRMVTRTCILIFCFSAKMVEDVWETEDTIITRIIPEQSDCKYGETEWRVKSIDEDHSSIALHCVLEPSFWIPPFIGPFLLKQKIMSEAKKTINRIEALSMNS